MKHILLHFSGSWPIRVRFLHAWAARSSFHDRKGLIKKLLARGAYAIVTFAPIRNFRHGEGILIGCFHAFFFVANFFKARNRLPSKAKHIGSQNPGQWHIADSEYYDICPTDSGYPKDMGFTAHWESPRITGIQAQRWSTKNLDKNTQSFELAFPESYLVGTGKDLFDRKVLAMCLIQKIFN